MLHQPDTRPLLQQSNPVDQAKDKLLRDKFYYFFPFVFFNLCRFYPNYFFSLLYIMLYIMLHQCQVERIQATILELL